MDRFPVTASAADRAAVSPQDSGSLLEPHLMSLAVSHREEPLGFQLWFPVEGSQDRDFGVEQGRLNIWVPLTKVWGDNSLWVESTIGAKNYSINSGTIQLDSTSLATSLPTCSMPP